MSLTRAQWNKMWDEIKAIEREIKFCNEIPRGKRVIIITKIERVKEQIESVIGQME